VVEAREVELGKSQLGVLRRVLCCVPGVCLVIWYGGLVWWSGLVVWSGGLVVWFV
jgi:hypothetical protein